MSNVNNPNGFQFSSINRPFPPLEKVYEKQSSLNAAIFQCDVVHAIAGVSGFKKPPIEPFDTGTPGTTIPLGVCRNYGQAATRTRHSVIIDPQAEYHAQDNNATDGITAGDLGKNANVTFATAGSTRTGYSGHQINETGIASTSSLDLHLWALWGDPLNDFGPNARILVTFNKLRAATQIAGV